MLTPFDPAINSIYRPNIDRDRAVEVVIEAVTRAFNKGRWQDYKEKDGDVIGLSVQLAATSRDKAQYRDYKSAVQEAMTRLQAAGWDRAEYDFDTGYATLERHRNVLTVRSGSGDHRIICPKDPEEEAKRIATEGVWVSTPHGVAYLPHNAIEMVILPEGFRPANPQG